MEVSRSPFLFRIFKYKRVNYLKLKVMKNVIEFLEDNKVELVDKMIKLNYFDEEDDDVDEICLIKGCYFDDDNKFIDNVDYVCNVVDGFDVSFERKYVKDTFGDANEVEIEINNIKLYCLLYNV